LETKHGKISKYTVVTHQQKLRAEHYKQEKWKQQTAAERVNKQACALSFLFARKSLHIGNLPYNRGRGTLQSPQTHFFQRQARIIICQTYIQQDEKRRGTKIALTELQISGGISHLYVLKEIRLRSIATPRGCSRHNINLPRACSCHQQLTS